MQTRSQHSQDCEDSLMEVLVDKMRSEDAEVGTTHTCIHVRMYVVYVCMHACVYVCMHYDAEVAIIRYMCIYACMY
jgi:hypothetical protein